MTEYELGQKLKEMYEEGIQKKEKTTQIHLFGIIYADVIRGNNLNIVEIIKFSGISSSYNVEVNKGIKLSKYVELKHT